MILFGSATPVSKIVTEAMPIFVGSLLRVGLGALVLLPFAWRRFGELRALDRRDWLFVAGIAVFGMVGFSALMLYGMRMISGVGGAIVMATTPAVTAGAAMLFFGERATRRKLVAIVLAVAGVAILQITSRGDEGAGDKMLLGALFIFGAVCCEAAYTLLGRKVSKDVSPLLTAFIASAASAPLFAVASVFQWSAFTPAEIDAGAWSATVWYGAGTLALGTAFWYSGVAKTQGSIAAVFMGLMPVSALVLSYALLGEAFRWSHLAGFAVVFAGVVLISLEHLRMK